MTVSNQTVNFIKAWEKLSLEPYADNKQWSIGYGTFAGAYPGPKPALKLRDEQEAHSLLMNDLKSREQTIKTNLKRNLNENQFSALVSFAFNAGVGAAQKVIDDINRGDLTGAVSRMLLYVYSAGKKLGGLEKRRKAEAELFNKPEGPLYLTDAPNDPRKIILTVALIVAITALLFKWNF